MTKKTYGTSDPRAFNADTSTDTQKAYFSMAADREVERIVSRYKDAPQFLLLLSLKLKDHASRLNEQFLSEQEAKSRKRDGQGRFTPDKPAWEDQYSPDGTFKGKS